MAKYFAAVGRFSHTHNSYLGEGGRNLPKIVFAFLLHPMPQEGIKLRISIAQCHIMWHYF